MASMPAKDGTPRLTNQPSNSSIDDKNPNDFAASDPTLEVAKAADGVDVVTGLFSGHAEDAAIDHAYSRKIRAKLDRHLLPLLFILYTIQFMDKNSIASSNILGILTDAKLSTNQFNNLSTAFYAGYVCFVLPHALFMQWFPIAKYIGSNIFIWSVLVGLQCLCKDYGSMFAMRFLLGASESCITTGIMTIISMFFTRLEITERIGWTFQCNGFAQIFAGFIAFGIAHVHGDKRPHPWQWFMVVLALLSFCLSVLFLVFMPDNPASARFLTEEEKVAVVQRIRVNQNGIETKKWKKHQFIEALLDVKTWFFFFFGAIANLCGGVGVEYGAIIKAMRFNTEQATLLNIPAGFAQIIAVTLGCLLLRRFPNSRTTIAMAGCILPIMACFILLFLDLKHNVGLVIQIYFVETSTVSFVMILSLCAVNFAGHTKKMTANAVFFVGYAIGQMLNTQFWKIQYRPRNAVPWTIVLVTFVFDFVAIGLFRLYLIRENRLRDQEQAASGKAPEEFGYVELPQADGSVKKVKLPIQFLDLTDKENRSFRYSL